MVANGLCNNDFSFQKRQKLHDFVNSVEITVKYVPDNEFIRHAVAIDTKNRINHDNFNIIRPNSANHRVFRAKVNYIRHAYTNYDEILGQLRKRSEPQKGYISNVLVPILKKRVNDAIIAEYWHRKVEPNE